MREYIMNYNHARSMSDIEMCERILKSIAKLSQESQAFFHENTPIGVININN
jgi:hypothetical protein